MLNVAIQAIKKAGDFVIKQYEFVNRNTSYVSSNHIKLFISKIHIESNHIISTVINKFYPSHVIINTNQNDDLYYNHAEHPFWIIESIDNNINFLKQFPFFTLSIAVQHKEHIELGVIYDPIHNELFSACRGQGAQCNGYRIRLNSANDNNIKKHLNTAILALSCFHFKDNITIINILHALSKKYIIVDFRRTGSIILDLVYVAINRLDGCIIISLKKTNKFASAILIIRESGGLVVDFNGNHITCPFKLSGNIIIGHSKIIRVILSLIKNNKLIHTK